MINKLTNTDKGIKKLSYPLLLKASEIVEIKAILKAIKNIFPAES